MDLISTFVDLFGSSPTILARAPGRVNLLGEHVDYNAGPVLPAAINRAVCLAASATPPGILQLFARDLKKHISIGLDQLESKTDLDGYPLPRWALYPAGVAWALQEEGLLVSGLQTVYASDIPIGSGLSSSAAVEMAFAVTWQMLGGWQIERMTLAQLCQRAENEYVGVACGLMDQFASAHGVEGHALYFDARSLEWEALPLPGDTVLVIADSGVRRSLANSAYNQRRAECEQAVELLRHFLPHIQTLRDVSTTEFAAFSENLPPVVRRRAEHVVKEIHRVHTAVTALRLGDQHTFGALMYAGHASMRDLYEASTPELDALVDIARELPGCYGARLTGAGFGGCTINLVTESGSVDFINNLKAAYTRHTGREALVYICQASEGAKAESPY